MEHSNKYQLVSHYYRIKMWDESRVRNAVVKGWITADEFKEITGKDYN